MTPQQALIAQWRLTAKELRRTAGANISAAVEADAFRLDACAEQLEALDAASLDQTAEQQARDLLERIGVPDAQSYSSGDLVELANLIAGVRPTEQP
jgi:hypothetical protein